MPKSRSSRCVCDIMSGLPGPDAGLPVIMLFIELYSFGDRYPKKELTPPLH